MRNKVLVILGAAVFMLALISISNAETVTTSKSDIQPPGTSTTTTAVREHTHTVDIPNPQIEDNSDDVTTKAKFDAPKLVKLSENWSVGIEASKQLNSTHAEQGWEAVAKVTFWGTLFDFSKK